MTHRILKSSMMVIAMAMLCALSSAANNYQMRQVPYHDIVSLVQGAAATYKIPSAYLAAVIEAESSYKSHATSPVGAMGLMQLMPKTAYSLGVQKPFDPVVNVYAGAKYLRQMLDEFNGNYVLATAAYNAGPDAVRRFKGVPPYWETMNYVPRVFSYYHHFRKLEKKYLKAS